MRIVVTGATGNVGTSVLRTLAEDRRVDEIVGIARRHTVWFVPKTTWYSADVARDPLAPLFRGADVMIHLAWLTQPSHRERVMARTNVDGTARVLEAVLTADVPAVVYASSVGAYSPGPKDRTVDESWPTDGIATSIYSRHKSAVERLLDDFERSASSVRVVRLRPALIFRRDVGVEIRRLFLGPFFPNPLLRPALIPFMPETPGLRFQAVHSFDVADAYRRAALEPVRGPFNIAADPILDAVMLSRVFRARRIPIPARALRLFVAATWHAHLQPTEPGWIDLALHCPLLDTTCARAELEWRPRHTAVGALEEIVAGLRDGAEFPTPPLSAATTGPLRLREVASGVGGV